MKRYFAKNGGFTLIELLVVIAVIGMLASIVLVSLGPVRAKARDSKRVSSIIQVQKALELYFDKYGSYPKTTVLNSPPDNYFVGDCSGSNAWQSFLSGKIGEFVSIPDDPNFPNNAWPLCFFYQSQNYHECPGGNSTYTMIFATEASTFQLPLYAVQGEGGTKARYCVYGNQ